MERELHRYAQIYSRPALLVHLTFSNVPSTVAVLERHGDFPNENTRIAYLPSLRSKV